MFWKALTMVLCLALAAAVGGWYGLFHVVVGLPVLLVGALLWKILRGRFADAEQALDGEVDQDEPSVVHGVCMGLVASAVAVGMLAGAFPLATAVGLRDLVEGPSCRAVVDELAILNQAKSYAVVVSRLDEALQQRWGAACQHTLRTAKVEALLGQAGRYPKPNASHISSTPGRWPVRCKIPDCNSSYRASAMQNSNAMRPRHNMSQQRSRRKHLCSKHKHRPPSFSSCKSRIPS